MFGKIGTFTLTVRRGTMEKSTGLNDLPVLRHQRKGKPSQTKNYVLRHNSNSSARLLCLTSRINMITAQGYSKDPNIVPEGVAITFGKEMMEDQGGAKTFLTAFLKWMDRHEEGKSIPGLDKFLSYFTMAD